jgi:hypothetical protein
VTNTSDLLRVNFTIAPAAKAAIERLTREHDERFGRAGAMAISWGHREGADPLTGNVTLGFYSKAQLPEIERGIQEVSGVQFVYFTTDEFHPLFDGKVIDHSPERGFFLREP